MKTIAKEIEINPFKDITTFPNNMYYMNKKSGKPLTNKPNRGKAGKQGKEDRVGSREKESFDNKKIENFECFICGFKVNMDKNRVES